jgi:hypothetical protein
MIYPHRTSAIVGDHQSCLKREYVAFNYPDCPYNKSEWKMHEKYKDTKEA